MKSQTYRSTKHEQTRFPWKFQGALQSLLHGCAPEILARFSLWSNGYSRGEGEEERLHWRSTIRHPLTFMESGIGSAKGLDGSAVVRGVGPDEVKPLPEALYGLNDAFGRMKSRHRSKGSFL